MERRDVGVSLAAVERQLEEARLAGADRAILVGGEPTIRRDLIAVARRARSLGLGLGLVTNGLTLVYPKLRATLAALGLDAVIIGSAGHLPGAGDALVRSDGATELATRALTRLLEDPRLTLELRIVLHGGVDAESLAAQLEQLAQLAGSRRGTYAVLAYQTPSRSAPRGLPELLPDRAAELVAGALEAASSSSLPVYHTGLPECLTGPRARYGIDSVWRPFASGMQTDSCLPEAPDHVQPLDCSECLANGRCPGLPRRVVEELGFDRVRPIKGVRSNSFDFTDVERLEGFVPGGDDCTGPELPWAAQAARAIYLVGNEATTVYTTDTRSFATEEIHEITHRRQQLYIDVSNKVALDDFQQDVRQLRLLKACKGCLHHRGCPSAFVVSDEVPFFREERWLRQEIERMVGRILDVGCGDLRYQDIVGELARGDKVEYHGLDPDAEAIARLRASRIPMQLHVMDVEEFDHDSGYFDYVLMLRSLNHFRDLRATFDLVTRLLRNHGNMIVSECLPFGLLRSQRKALRAHESLEPGFEHYRNWSSEQLLEFLEREGYPFRVNIHRPVQPKAANMWLLKLIKIEP